MRTRALAVLLSIGLCAGLLADGFAASPKADCLDGPTAQFGRYIGDWQITDQTLKRDGSGWEPGAGARWIFECIGGGTAVQDFWMPTSGQFGTNLRRYNPERALWEIVWTASTLPGLQRIEASLQPDDSLLMTILDPLPDPPRRIIFYPPDDSGWDWVQQMSFDGGETWVDVYKIRAMPHPAEANRPSPEDRQE